MSASVVETAVRERPILFSGPMVRAILDGRKTQTRRVVTPTIDVSVPFVSFNGGGYVGPGLDLWAQWANQWGGDYRERRCPFGAPGDRLWVRETWAPMCHRADPHCWCEPGDESHHYTEYRADTNDARPGDWPEDEEGDYVPRWRPSIHMPRARSRLTLEVTGVRVERVRDISEADAIAEGAEPAPCTASGCSLPHVHGYAKLWDSLYERGGPAWGANPWVWVVEFRKVTP